MYYPCSILTERSTASITLLCVDPSRPLCSSKPIDGKIYLLASGNMSLLTTWIVHSFGFLMHTGYAYARRYSLKDQYASLKPFQRKWALVATSVELLKTLDFLNDYQRQEIMFRTGTSKEQLPPVLAW